MSDYDVPTVVCRAIRDILSKDDISYSNIGTYEICVSINDHENCYVVFNKTSVAFKNYSYFSYSKDDFIAYYSDPDLFDNVLRHIKTLFHLNG